jgi:transposase
LQQYLPHAKIVYDKFHVLRHVSEGLDETRRAEFFRQGAEARGLIRGKRWLLRRRWANLDWEERHTLRELFALNRRLAKAYLLKEQLTQLRSYTYEAAASRFLTNWLLALRRGQARTSRLNTRRINAAQVQACVRTAARGSLELEGVVIRGRTAVADDLRAPACTRGEDAVIQKQVHRGAW